MKCKYCKNEIPEGSLFCMFCSEKVFRKKSSKKTAEKKAVMFSPASSKSKVKRCKKCKNEIQEGHLFCPFCGSSLVKTAPQEKDVRVPPPKLLPSGSYFCQMMIRGKRVSVTAENEAEYYAKARAYKVGALEIPEKPQKITLFDAQTLYINNRPNTCSPSTIKGYYNIRKNRFKRYSNLDIHSINRQKMVDDEVALKVSAKTITNAMYFISSCVKAYGIQVHVTLPQIIEKPAKWLPTDDVRKFLSNLDDTPLDLSIGILLALHGLRKSEVYAVTPDNIRNGHIYVEGAYVESVKGFVLKETNKNSTSRRKVPIMMTALSERVSLSTCPHDKPYMSSYSSNDLYREINRICECAGLERIGVHGLRKTLASIAFVDAKVGEHELQRIGGWKDHQTMHRVYIQVSDKDVASAASKIGAILDFVKK